MSEENTSISSEPPGQGELATDEPAKTEPAESHPAQTSEPAPVSTVAELELPPTEDPSTLEKEKSESEKEEPSKPHRKLHFLITWAIVLVVAGFVDLTNTLFSKEGAKELRASNSRVMTYLHNLQPFQATDDFTGRLDSSEYGWGVLNWDAPFNITVARDRLDRRFRQQLDLATQAATNDSSMPDVENRVQQAWQNRPVLGSQSFADYFADPHDFNEAVGNVLQAQVDALPYYKEYETWTLGFKGSDGTPLSVEPLITSSRLSSYESQLPTDPDFSRILATFRSAILMAGIHYDDSLKRLNTYRFPAFLTGQDTAPLDRPEDNPPNIFEVIIVKAPGLLDAYMNTVRQALGSSRAQTVIEIIALVAGAVLLFLIRNNNCFTVVIKLFFVPLAGSLVVGLIWGIAYVITALFGKILAAPAIDVLGSTFAAPFLHWGAGRIMEHHLSEKAIEKYAHAAERKLLDK